MARMGLPWLQWSFKRRKGDVWTLLHSNREEEEEVGFFMNGEGGFFCREKGEGTTRNDALVMPNLFPSISPKIARLRMAIPFRLASSEKRGHYYYFSQESHNSFLASHQFTPPSRTVASPSRPFLQPSVCHPLSEGEGGGGFPVSFIHSLTFPPPPPPPPPPADRREQSGGNNRQSKQWADRGGGGKARKAAAAAAHPRRRREGEYGNGSLNCLQKPWKRKGCLGLCMGGGNLGVYGPSSSSPPHPALCQQSSLLLRSKDRFREREKTNRFGFHCLLWQKTSSFPRKKTIPSQQLGGGGGQFSGASAVPCENLGVSAILLQREGRMAAV